jgi:hypothetical protein
MLTIDQTIEYLDTTIAEYLLAGNTVGLKHIQTAAGVMMAAAQTNGDKDTANRFRIVAAHAANKIEELGSNDD